MFPSVVWLAVLGALGVSATSSHVDLTPTVDRSKFVSTNGAGFRVNNSDFRFIGTNAYWLPVLNSDEDVNSVLGNISLANITVVRTWAFNDVPEIPKNGTWFQLVASGTTSINLNETTGVPKLDRIISMAEQHGIYLLFSLTNNWNPLPFDNTTPNSRNPTSSTLSRRDILTNNRLPRNTLSNDYGGMDAYVRAFGADSHDAFYTNETIIAAFENYTSHIVSRYVNSTAILGWEIGNDPRCNSSIGATPNCSTTTITLWLSRIAQFIRAIDPNHLISSGTQGFFCAECPKLFQKNARRNKVEPLTKKRILKEGKEAREKEIALKLRSEPPISGVRVRGKWIATPTRRQDDAGTGSAFDGSKGVDSEDILSIPQIGFGSFQLFPDQNSYAPDDPNLSAFNYTLLAGLDWIQQHGELGQEFGKPVILTAFGLVTQDNAPSFVPFNSTIAPFANDQFGNLTLSGTQLPFGITDQQRDYAYAQWLQRGILKGLTGMIQYQWGQGNLTAVNGTAISLLSPTIDENGIVPVQSHNGLSPSDGYSIAGFGTGSESAIIKTPPSVDSKSESNLGAIVGGVGGGLVVIALGILFLWRYLRRVRAKSQNDRVAVPAQFLFDTRELGHPAPTSLSTSAAKRRPRNNTSLPTDGHPTIPTESGPNRSVHENEPPADNSRRTNSRNFHSLENRLATLEALVVLQRPPPYVDNDE